MRRLSQRIVTTADKVTAMVDRGTAMGMVTVMPMGVVTDAAMGVALRANFANIW
jgi:hypothetical protein